MFPKPLSYLLVAACLLLTASMSIVAVAAVPAMAEDLANGAKVFRKCRACHDAGPMARNKVGPVLNGVYGRTAGTFPDFNYSKAMVEAGGKRLVWDEVTLNGYLEAPTTYLPKNKMAFTGIKDEGERADLIGYLKTLK
ncbi:MAG: cytochrome c family protein [Hyphomicrobiaceae bacterium]|nr:cytochrome c family protein [Hyphomicrobiaceae bacterium]